jgi:hypothetical protein
MTMERLLILERLRLSFAVVIYRTERNLAIASSRVAAVPFVTPFVAGTMAVTDQNHRMSGGVLADASS